MNILEWFKRVEKLEAENAQLKDEIADLKDQLKEQDAEQADAICRKDHEQDAFRRELIKDINEISASLTLLAAEYEARDDASI